MGERRVGAGSFDVERRPTAGNAANRVQIPCGMKKHINASLKLGSPLVGRANPTATIKVRSERLFATSARARRGFTMPRNNQTNRNDRSPVGTSANRKTGTAKLAFIPVHSWENRFCGESIIVSVGATFELFQLLRSRRRHRSPPLPRSATRTPLRNGLMPIGLGDFKRGNFGGK